MSAPASPNRDVLLYTTVHPSPVAVRLTTSGENSSATTLATFLMSAMSFYPYTDYLGSVGQKIKGCSLHGANQPRVPRIKRGLDLALIFVPVVHALQATPAVPDHQLGNMIGHAQPRQIAAHRAA